MDLPQKFIASVYANRGSVVYTEPGSVIQTDHGKFLVVINRIEDSVKYVVVNHKENRYAQSCEQPKVTKQDAPCLCKYPISYVDCSQVFSMDFGKFEEGFSEKKFVAKGKMAPEAMARISDAGLRSPKLRGFEKEWFK